MRKGWVNAEDNENWVFVPNNGVRLNYSIPSKDRAGTATCRGGLCRADTQGWRSKLFWYKQTDTFSCGPLAAAAALLVLQGCRPFGLFLGYRNVAGAKAELAYSGNVLLRDSMAVLWLDIVAEGAGLEGAEHLEWLRGTDAQAELQTWKSVFWNRPNRLLPVAPDHNALERSYLWMAHYGKRKRR